MKTIEIILVALIVLSALLYLYKTLKPKQRNNGNGTGCGCGAVNCKVAKINLQKK
jgi:hypothetical protein